MTITIPIWLLCLIGIPVILFFLVILIIVIGIIVGAFNYDE